MEQENPETGWEQDDIAKQVIVDGIKASETKLGKSPTFNIPKMRPGFANPPGFSNKQKKCGNREKRSNSVASL